jgi:hypothetical protein
MEKIKFKARENEVNYSIDHMMEAFNDILEAMNNKLFKDIELIQDNEGIAIRYYVTINDKQITKYFETDQGEPELKADIMEYLFSMLDGVANI